MQYHRSGGAWIPGPLGHGPSNRRFVGDALVGVALPLVTATQVVLMHIAARDPVNRDPGRPVNFPIMGFIVTVSVALLLGLFIALRFRWAFFATLAVGGWYCMLCGGVYGLGGLVHLGFSPAEKHAQIARTLLPVLATLGAQFGTLVYVVCRLRGWGPPLRP